MWRNLIEICRFRNLIIAGLTVPLGAHIALDGFWTVQFGSDSLIAMLSVMSFMAAGNILNDVSDIEIDLHAHPSRVIPSGRMSIEVAKRWAIFFSLLSLLLMCVLLARTHHYPVPVIWISAAFLMITYDHGPCTKDKGLIGNIAISLMVGAVIVFGAASVTKESSSLVIYAASVAALANLAREVIKDCEDFESDIGRLTLPMSIGLEKSRMLAYVVLLSSLVVLYIPHWLGPLEFWQIIFQTPAILILITLNGPLQKGEDHEAQQRVRLAMLLGLIGFASEVSI